MNSIDGPTRILWAICLFVLTVMSVSAPSARAGEPFRVDGRPVIETRFAPRVVIQGSQSLGTFEPTPYVFVRGNGTTGGGYSPLQVYGDQTMVMYGPTSVYRGATAPVTTYTRGYDGALYPVTGISFSNPNLPGLSPVVYPTRYSNYFRARTDRWPALPPKDSQNWIDQN